MMTEEIIAAKSSVMLGSCSRAIVQFFYPLQQALNPIDGEEMVFDQNT
jgi:hypothetical protein